MNETLVTLQGWLGTDVTLRQAGETPVASFRVACTPRRYQKKTDEWVDGATQWFSVNAWRALAEHCERSLRRGDPVVVHGRLNAQVWANSAGMEVTSYDVEAVVVGHDLNRGTSTFVRPPRPLGEAGSSGAAGDAGREAGDGGEEPVGAVPAA
ncbi:MAG TPA: single-stranded DNA-binding protein [Nocardioides sp.]|jgi:single-strand DNA-binding protein|nr:single-stranded DNA-binding protein [Nocardioides sp.]